MSVLKTKSFELAIFAKGNKDSNKLAIIIPGRLDTKDYVSCTSHVEFLAAKGFYALAFDPPGTWDSPGGIDLFTTTNYIKAVDELIEYFGNRETFLLGHSRGGQVAMLVGTSNPQVRGFTVVNSSYGPPDPPDPEKITDGVIVNFRDFPPGDKKTSEQKKFLLPIKYFEDGEQYDPIPTLKLCKKPKLIFYSADDAFAEPQEVEEIFKKLPDPKMIHKLNTEHDYRYHKEVIEKVNKVTGQFLDTFLI